MKRILLTTLAFWVLLLSPGLCLSGALAHICGDCPESSACEHEDDCANDPCAIDLLPPGTVKIINVSVSPAVPVQGSVDHESIHADPLNFPVASLPPLRDNLPRPESDLPLLS
jgi:hypothetical protein